MKYSNLEIFQNRNKFQIRINDKDKLLVVNGEKEMDEKQVYSLFMMQTYETCLHYLDYITEHPKETNELIDDMDSFLDMYSLSKKEFQKIQQELQNEIEA